MRNNRRPLLFLKYFFVLTFLSWVGCKGGCGCDDDNLSGLQCIEDGECPDGEIFRFGRCESPECSATAPCCPGSECTNINGTDICRSSLLGSSYACTEDRECPNTAQRCLPLETGHDDSNTNSCQFERCSTDAECQNKLENVGATCYNSVCITEVPCRGGCEIGEICDVLTDSCYTAPELSDASCRRQSACPNNGLLVSTDPDSMSGEQCCDVSCECLAVPPVKSSRFGRYPSVGLTDSEILVAAYDADFGDLVLAHYSQSRSLLFVVFIDGVPTNADVTGNPNGPRGGIEAAGPDVGTHTSLVVSNNEPFITYHTPDGGALKFAYRDPDSKLWKTYELDTPARTSANVGLFATMERDPTTNRLVIAYMYDNDFNVSDINGLSTGLRLARAKVEVPTTKDDWDIFDISATEEPTLCEGGCGATQDCVIADNNEVMCRERRGDCAQECGDNRTCVALLAVDENGDTSGCRPYEFATESEALPRGHGLHPSIAFDSGIVHIAHYDSYTGDLWLSSVLSNGESTNRIIDGDGREERVDGDMGRFPSIIASGNRLSIAYTDFNRHALKLWEGTPTTIGRFSVIDDGRAESSPTFDTLGTTGLRFVGADARLHDLLGELVVVYQDATTLDLKIAHRTGGDWIRSALLATGANGFYIDTVVKDQDIFISSTTGEIDNRGTERSTIKLDVRGF